jgi:hypothetical protein
MNIASLNIFRGFHLRKKIVVAYQQHVDYRREAALRMWVAFIVTFVFLRALTFGIRYHLLPVGNVVTSGGLHIHAYWLREGRSSVDLAIVVAALLGLYYAADRFWKQALKEVQGAMKFVTSQEGRLFHARSTTTTTK